MQLRLQNPFAVSFSTCFAVMIQIFSWLLQPILTMLCPVAIKLSLQAVVVLCLRIYDIHFHSIVMRLCSNKVQDFYQYLAFIFSMACSCSEPFFLANLSIAESGTPPRVEANCVKNQSFIGLLRPTLPMNFWIPYLKLCCQVLYMTPSFPGSIVLPMSKNSDFSRRPIGTKVSGVVVNMLSGCSVSSSCKRLIVSQLSSCVSSLSRPMMSVNAGTQ